jgi:hypothetical protein
MALLRTIHRAAFICNLFFLLALFILWLRHPINSGLSSIILVLGFFVSVLLNVVVNIWGMTRRFSKKSMDPVPRWLRIVNGGFLAVQLILLLK